MEERVTKEIKVETDLTEEEINLWMQGNEFECGEFPYIQMQEIDAEIINITVEE